MLPFFPFICCRHFLCSPQKKLIRKSVFVHQQPYQYLPYRKEAAGSPTQHSSTARIYTLAYKSIDWPNLSPGDQATGHTAL
jgi:hypothetical protein